MKKKLIFVFLTLTLVSCKKEKKVFANVINIEEVSAVPKIKTGFDVVINKRLDKTELESLGRDLYHEYDGKDYQNFFVNYYLQKMIEGNGSYASTNFTPDFEVDITGLTNEQISEIEGRFGDKEPFYIDDGWKCVTKIKNENGKYFLKRAFVDFTTDKMTVDKWILTPVIKNKDTLFFRKNSETKEYFKYNTDGDLEWYDKQGFIDKFLRDSFN